MARGSSRATRLSKTWSGAIWDSVALTTTQAALANVTLLEGAGQDATVLRSRGDLIIQGVPDAASDREIAAFGIGIVQANALAIGGTSLPSPVGDIGWDGWLWHRFVALEGNPLTAADPQAILLNRIIEIDSKAMRRLPQDSAVVLVGELSVGSFAFTVTSGGIRWLLGT